MTDSMSRYYQYNSTINYYSLHDEMQGEKMLTDWDRQWEREYPIRGRTCNKKASQTFLWLSVLQWATNFFGERKVMLQLLQQGLCSLFWNYTSTKRRHSFKFVLNRERVHLLDYSWNKKKDSKFSSYSNVGACEPTCTSTTKMVKVVIFQ